MSTASSTETAAKPMGFSVRSACIENAASRTNPMASGITTWRSPKDPYLPASVSPKTTTAQAGESSSRPRTSRRPALGDVLVGMVRQASAMATTHTGMLMKKPGRP